MRTFRWLAVFVIAAVAAGWIGVQAVVPAAKAQDMHVVDTNQGTDTPMLQERPMPDRPGQPGGGMMPGMGQGMMPGAQMMMPPAVAMWGDDKNLFILRDNMVFRLDKQTLAIKAHAELPNPKPPMPMGDRGPMQPGMEEPQPPQPPR